MKYTTQQIKYIDSVEGKAHMSAVAIIGVLEEKLNKATGILKKVIEFPEAKNEIVMLQRGIGTSTETAIWLKAFNFVKGEDYN
jgi:hypothetical protein